jgi:TDG/mug DNA glycosylase family protein
VPDLDVPTTKLPVALARVHAATPVGRRVEIRVARPGDNQPGAAGPPPLSELLAGAGFEQVTVQAGRRCSVVGAVRARTLPDVVGPAMRALVCGLNPSLVAADAGYAYAGANNRFWPAACSAGLVTVARRPFEALERDRVGITDIVKRATARSSQLDRSEYRAGIARVGSLVGWLRPAVVIFVGLEGWRAAVDPRARPGWQEHTLGEAPSYVMPSTSGANARVGLSELTDHLRHALDGP